jgi:hypothetical protein
MIKLIVDLHPIVKNRTAVESLSTLHTDEGAHADAGHSAGKRRLRCKSLHLFDTWRACWRNAQSRQISERRIGTCLFSWRKRSRKHRFRGLLLSRNMPTQIQIRGQRRSVSPFHRCPTPGGFPLRLIAAIMVPCPPARKRSPSPTCRDMGVRGLLIYLLGLPVQPPAHHEGRSLARRRAAV